MSAEPPRIAALDGLRGVAILLILLGHYFVASTQFENLALKRVLDLYWVGVDLFFILSGFLIGGILLDRVRRRQDFKVFYIRRACRILPVYFFWLLLYILARKLDADHVDVLQRVFADPVPLLSYATFTQNITMGLADSLGPTWLAVTWSLAVEEQFYLLMPLLLLLFGRGWRLAALLTLLLVAVVWTRWNHLSLMTIINLWGRGDGLLFGVLLAFAVRQPGALRLAGRRQAWLLTTCAALLAYTGYTVWHNRWPLLILVLIAFTVLLLAVLAAPQGRAARWLARPWLCWFGRLSYAIYIFPHGCVGTQPRGAA